MERIELITGGDHIARFLTGVQAESYEVKAIHQNRQKAQKWTVTARELLQIVPILSAKNQQLFNIYARPLDARFILLDDLKREILAELATVKPCVLMETSPNNYMAWLKMETIPENLPTAWQEVADMFGADRKSAYPNQIGRLPGFFNVKEKYSPAYPLVMCHKAENRFSTYSPSASYNPEPVPPLTSPPPVIKRSGYDRSGFDWAVCCTLVKKGWTDSQIREYLIARSEKARTRKDDYLGRTIAKAREKFG